MNNKMPVATESAEQQCLFRWAAHEYCNYHELDLLYHIPNEGKRSPNGGRRLKAEGLKSGVPDIHLPVARSGYHGLYIELKREKGSTTTKNQDIWLEALNKQGYLAIVCKGWKEASEKILSYLEGLK
jgi:hypothetical protein